MLMQQYCNIKAACSALDAANDVMIAFDSVKPKSGADLKQG